MERLCPVEFESYPCLRGHRIRQGKVTNLYRRHRHELSNDQAPYEITVELRCDDCKKTDRRIIRGVIGSLLSIKKVTIGLNGIETERVEC